MTFKRGDFVQLSAGGRTVKAMVVLASGNGVALMFDGMLLGHLGMMPVLRNEQGEWRTVMTNELVGIEASE
jgi:hypothetical protein